MNAARRVAAAVIGWAAHLTCRPGGGCPCCPDDGDVARERERTYESYPAGAGDAW